MAENSLHARSNSPMIPQGQDSIQHPFFRSASCCKPLDTPTPDMCSGLHIPGGQITPTPGLLASDLAVVFAPFIFLTLVWID
jgi:hypothetical protein